MYPLPVHTFPLEVFDGHLVLEIDGVRVYGHMDYGKRAPDLGWRMTDAWLSMAGAGSKGLPNGVPIDEWGIRMESGSCNPGGASVTRGGGTNGPAAVYAIRKWDEWLRQYAPPGAADYDFYQSLPALSQGNVAQQIFWYTAFTASMVAPKDSGNNTVDDDGNVYGADDMMERVQKFDADGNFLRMWGWDVDSSLAGTGLEICTVAANCKAGTEGDGAGQFDEPEGIAVNSSLNRALFRLCQFNVRYSYPAVTAHHSCTLCPVFV